MCSTAEEVLQHPTISLRSATRRVRGDPLISGRSRVWVSTTSAVGDRFEDR